MKRANGSTPAIAKLGKDWVLPPKAYEFLRDFVRRSPSNKPLSPPEYPTPLSQILFPKSDAEPFWAPVEKILNGAGQSFTTEQHHYMRYLESGFDDLESFYKLHQPRTALEHFFLEKGTPDYCGPSFTSPPWHPASSNVVDAQTRIPGSSDTDVKSEAARLKNVGGKIVKKGSIDGHPMQAGGQIRSQLLLHDNGDFRIVVVHGNHRTAVLTHLGWELIPLHFQAGCHPVRLSDLAEWPGVVDGRFTPETARLIFEAFFRPRHQQLLPGW